MRAGRAVIVGKAGIENLNERLKGTMSVVPGLKPSTLR
jgi:hypothetical protein